MIVVDTNLIAYLLIDGPHTDLAEDTFRTEPQWLVPSLWKAEFLNVLVTYARVYNLEIKQVQQIWKATQRLHLTEQNPSENLVLKLALSSGCSAYDCMFVSLAAESRTILVTFDKKILQQFPQYALHPKNFLTR